MCDRGIEISSIVFFINLVDIFNIKSLATFCFEFFGNIYYVRLSNWGKEKCMLSVLWHVVLGGLGLLLVLFNAWLSIAQESLILVFACVCVCVQGISPSITGRILMKIRMDIPVHHAQCV